MGYLPSPASGGGHIVNKEKIFTNIKVLWYKKTLYKHRHVTLYWHTTSLYDRHYLRHTHSFHSLQSTLIVSQAVPLPPTY
jgi:hypothetical protein